MTNREWLESLPDDSFVEMIKDCCSICVENNHASCTDCYKGITTWLRSEHEEPRELTKTQIREVLMKKFLGMRVIGPEEIERTIDDLFSY